HQLSLAGQCLDQGELLGVDFEPAAMSHGYALLDAYQRGGDLIASYAQAPSATVSIQIYWRAALFEFAGIARPSVDLQISVQTSLLDSRPGLRTRSHLPACAVERIGSLLAANHAAIGASTPTFSREAGAGCFVFRPWQGNFSYAEMAHPSDAAACELHDGADATEIAHRLFEGNLEKGVIVRGRVRGVVVPRSEDLEFALAAWNQFVEQPPPLTT
ncbi:MAG: hypothetical protein ACREJM_07750, partial [Candidatus Saccharimonadales bacterium]